MSSATTESSHKKSNDETEKKVESEKEAVSLQKECKQSSSTTRAARLIVVTFRDAIEKVEDQLICILT